MTHRPILLCDWNTLRSNVSSALTFEIAVLCLLLCGCSGRDVATASSVGVAATQNVNKPPVATPGTLTFTQAAATVSTKTVDVTSPKSDPITATIVSGGDFQLASASCSEGATTCHIAVTFSAGQLQTASGTLLLTDTVTGLDTTVPLMGTSYLPPVASPGPPSARMPPVLTPGTLSFGSVQEGLGSAVQTVMASGPGPLILQITGSQFTLMPGTSCASSLIRCAIGISFTPTIVGPASGSLQVGDTTTGLFSIAALTGLGTRAPAPALTLSKASITAPPTSVGSTTVSQPVTLTNSGNVTLDLGSIVLSGTDSARLF